QFEGFEMFNAMIASIEEEVAMYLMKAEVSQNLERQEVIKGQGADQSALRTSGPSERPESSTSGDADPKNRAQRRAEQQERKRNAKRNQ
ncbi:hypothetical protein MXD81_19865, partial [Microbacteriaceae bacterium K1510]|nr:hypothetical protein [Microbacteriaceae bacterium K1510]